MKTLEKTLEDMMTRDLEVLGPRMPLRRAAEAMRRLGIDSLPVCEEGRLVGVVTHRDLVVRGVAMGHDVDQSPISAVMAEDVEGLTPGTSVEEAKRRLADTFLEGLFVVDEERHLLGWVPRGKFFPEEIHPPTARELEEFFSSGSIWH